MFVIDDVELFVCDYDAVTGSETFFYPAGEVQTLFNHDLWVGTEGFGFFYLF